MLSIECVEDAGGSNGIAPPIVAGVELHVAQQRFVRIGVVRDGKGKSTVLGQGAFERGINHPVVAPVV